MRTICRTPPLDKIACAKKIKSVGIRPRCVRVNHTNARTLEVTPLLSEFRLTNIVDRWIVQFACYVRRCVKQEAPSTSCAKFQRPVYRHCTRGQENSFRPFLANNHAGLVSFSNRAPLIWNSLPVDVREAPSLSSFKRRLLNILKEPCNLNKLSNICFYNPSIVQ